VDYKNDTFTDSFETLEKWKENRTLANSMVMFLFVSVQENLSGEIPLFYCIGTLPSNGCYDSEDIKN